MSYTAMGLVLEAVDLGKIQTSEKSVIMAMYLDFVFLFIILVLTHKTKNYLTSMVLILTGNSFLLALVGTMMAQGFQITNPTTFLLFVFTVLFLYIGFEVSYHFAIGLDKYVCFFFHRISTRIISTILSMKSFPPYTIDSIIMIKKRG
jgi:hypothetical protein